MRREDFLVEIGTEELPPKALKKLYLCFEQSISDFLKAADFNFEKTHAFASPRRLAVLVEGLIEQQPDKTVEKLGPNVKAAYDADGNPTKAAEGFARGCGVTVDQLETTEDAKGERLVFRSQQKGKSAVEELPTIVEQALSALPIPKRMRWGASRSEFIRPVHWLVMLYGKQLIECNILGVNSCRETRGHRFHCNKTLPLASAGDYQLTLEKGSYVIADFNERRGNIRKQVEEAGHKLGGAAVIDEDLLDEVTGLVEWPVALTGSFEERFLEVPAEALISSMKEHQKYFHVVDSDGKLLPNFITLSNIVSEDPAQVIAGNERVIRPRLSDAAFFYNTDRKTPLANRQEKLKTIVFQEKLGTVYDKSQRVAALAKAIAEQLHFDAGMAERAALLSKTDLVTEMVYEFADMQGIAGYHYALQDGEPEEVALALNEQYMPRFAGDELPHTNTGAVLALADRLDTLVGIFGIGQPPTGSKDPFALRRASLGILRIMVEKGFDLDLKHCLSLAESQYDSLPKSEGLVDTVLSYMIERFRAWYEEESIPVEVFFSVAAKNLSSPLDINQRVHAVNRFNQLPEAQALAAANKRVSNLLAKSEGSELPDSVDNSLLEETAEQTLAEQLTEKVSEVTPLFQQRKYTEGLEALASLREPVDQFFDQVMVMTDDEKLRDNRLALLNQLRSLFLEVADISLLVPSK